jgi:hypothetical protein
MRAVLDLTVEKYYKQTSGVMIIELPRIMCALLSSYTIPRVLRLASSEKASDTTPTTPATVQDRKKKQIKKGAVKKESIEKRPISAGSAESNTTAKRLLIGQPNVRTRAAIVKQDPEPMKEEPIEKDATEEDVNPRGDDKVRATARSMPRIAPIAPIAQ